ncbi:MAG: sensor histidine kinase, partial [bacterium]
NAVAAMGKRGTLTVTTDAGSDEIFVRIADTGVGIDDEALPRIFEPFFTTKQEKGTGLGLSISYKIITAHNGRIDIQSRKGEGSTFTVVLPVRTAALHGSL